MISSASSSASPSGVSVSCEPVITSVGAVIVRQLERACSSGIARIASTCATNACGFVCTSTRASTLTNTPNRRCRRGPISQRMPSSVSAGMPCSVTTLGPLGEQLAPPLVVPARGARERQRLHPIGMQHADDLRDHAAHRRADDVRALDARRVEHRDRVLRPSARGRRGRAARRSGRCRGCRSRCSGGGGRTRRAAAPSPRRPCRGPGSSAPAYRRAGPTRRTRCVMPSLGDDVARQSRASRASGA